LLRSAWLLVKGRLAVLTSTQGWCLRVSHGWSFSLVMDIAVTHVHGSTFGLMAQDLQWSGRLQLNSVL